MAEAATIARPYAQAVFKLADESDTLEAWSNTLALLAQVVADARVARLLADPNASREQTEKIVLAVCGEQVSGAGRNFVQVLAQNNRLAELPGIRTLYEELKRERAGVIEAHIISAFPIDDGQARSLVTKLESKYQRKVRAQVDVDPDLIGGVKIVVGDSVLDATVRGRLNAMSVALTR